MNFTLGAWLIVYVVNTIIIIRGVYFALKRKRAYSLFWAGLLLYQVLPLSSIDTLISEFDPVTLFKGQVFMLIGNTLLQQLVVILENRYKAVSLNSTNDSHLATSSNSYYILMTFTAVLAIGLRFWITGLDILYVNWESLRQESSSFVTSISQLLGFVFYPAAWVALKDRKWIWVIALLTLDILFFFISASRAIVLTLGCAVIFDLINSSIALKKKIGFLLLMGIVLFATHVFTRTARGFGLISAESGNIQLPTEISGDFSGGESAIYRYFNVVIESDRTEYPYRSGVTLVRLALMYIPRVWIFADKPQDITYSIWLDAVRGGYFDSSDYIARMQQIADTGVPGSLHPTFWGDAYCNLGWLGLAIYPLLMALAMTLSEPLLSDLTPLANSIVRPLIGISYTVIARGNVVIGVGYVAYVIPIVALLFLLTRIPIFTKQLGQNLPNSLVWS